MKAKTFLREYGRAQRKVEEIRKRLADLDELSTCITQTMEGDRVQTSPRPDRIGQVVARKLDLEYELLEAETDAMDTMNRIYAVLNKLEDPDYQQLLRLRYIKCLQWEEIREQMHYEIRNIFYIHGRALVAVEEIIN